MGKYSALDSNVFALFGTLDWQAEKIKTYPTNYIAIDTKSEFIRVSIIPSGLGVNIQSVSGILIIDIFTQAGNGPKKWSTIADKLDSYLSGKQLSPSTGIAIQFSSSSLNPVGIDKDNQALFKTAYTIPFNYFEVQQ